MNKTEIGVVLVLCVAIVAGAFIMRPQPTVEQIQARAQAEALVHEQRRLDEELRLKHIVDMEQTKTPEQKLEESRTDTGECLVQAAGIGAAALVGLKVLDIMAR